MNTDFRHLHQGNFELSDHNLISSLDGKIYYTVPEYLDKMYKSVNLSRKFSEMFFSAARRKAADFFSSIVFDVDIMVNDRGRFISLSNKSIYDIYSTSLSSFSSFLSIDNVFSSNNFITNDTHFFSFSKCVIALNFNLVKELVTCYTIKIAENRLYAFKEWSIDLKKSKLVKAKDFLTRPDYCLDCESDVLSLYKGIECIELNYLDALNVLKSLNIVSGNKRIKVLDEKIFFEIFSESDLEVIAFADNLELRSTNSGVSVGDFLTLFYNKYKSSDSLDMTAVYPFYEKCLEWIQ